MMIRLQEKLLNAAREVVKAAKHWDENLYPPNEGINKAALLIYIAALAEAVADCERER